MSKLKKENIIEKISDNICRALNQPQEKITYCTNGNTYIVRVEYDSRTENTYYTIENTKEKTILMCDCIHDIATHIHKEIQAS